MVVRIDVTEGRGEAIGIFLPLFFDFLTRQVSQGNTQHVSETITPDFSDLSTSEISKLVSSAKTPKAHRKKQKKY